MFFDANSGTKYHVQLHRNQQEHLLVSSTVSEEISDILCSWKNKCHELGWIKFIQDTVQYGTVVNTAINVRIS